MVLSKRFSALIVIIAISGCNVSVGQSQKAAEAVDVGTVDQQKAVVAAAHQVTEFFDQGQFDQAWAASSPLLQSRTNRTAFANSIKVMRSALGAAGHREVKGFNFPKTLDGLNGDFGIVGVDTDFTNARAVNEKFVFQKVDGQWKLAGYWLSKKYTLGPGTSN